MKKHAGGLSAAAFLTCLMSGGALAGGLAPAVPEPEPAPPALQVSNPFLGSYGGVSLGYVFNGDDEVGIRPPGGASTRIGDLDLSGALAGLHGGYRWQMRRLTVGVELGLVGGDVKDDFSTQGG